MLNIRDAVKADIPRLLELYAQLALNSTETYYAEPEPDFNRKALTEIQATPGLHLLVAEQDGDVVGTCMLCILPGLSRGIARWAVIEYVVVEKKLRSKGIGQAIMDHAVKMAEEAGCYKVMLCSNKKRTDAHRFYQRLGFEQTHLAFHRYFGKH